VASFLWALFQDKANVKLPGNWSPDLYCIRFEVQNEERRENVEEAVNIDLSVCGGSSRLDLNQNVCRENINASA
jgi:hypothetical protein